MNASGALAAQARREAPPPKSAAPVALVVRPMREPAGAPATLTVPVALKLGAGEPVVPAAPHGQAQEQLEGRIWSASPMPAA